jgi:hypothetical protein
MTFSILTLNIITKSLYADCHYAESHFLIVMLDLNAECRYADCRGPKRVSTIKILIVGLSEKLVRSLVNVIFHASLTFLDQRPYF